MQSWAFLRLPFRFFQFNHFWKLLRSNKLKWPISYRIAVMGQLRSKMRPAEPGHAGLITAEQTTLYLNALCGAHSRLAKSI
jgi:hypothetical protein